MTELKRFQKETVRTVLRAFRNKNGPRRFLVADEVGLGKTVIAQHVIQSMMRRRKKPLIVFYVCSNLSIASQNRKKLLEIFNSEEERQKVQCKVDRLTLIPAADPPTHPQLHLYTLTPATSIPIGRGKRRDGNVVERALIHVLVEELWPRFFSERGNNFFVRQAKVSFWNEVNNQRQKAQNEKLQRIFNESIRIEFEVRKGHQVLPTLRTIDDDLEIIVRMRNALATSGIKKIKPNLVIFDEFQRFRDLLRPNIDEAAARVIGRLRGDKLAYPPALLLLSATPYRLYLNRWEDQGISLHHKEFFDLVDFLYGNDELAHQKRDECEVAFFTYQQELRRGFPDSQDAHKARKQAEALLKPIIARTERLSHPDGWQDQTTTSIVSELNAVDLQVYRHLSESFAKEHRSSVVDFWTSIPMPMQTMDMGYTTWKKALSIRSGETPSLDIKMRNKFSQPRDWPHPRLRTFVNELDQLVMPWRAPSLPWWKLINGWEKQINKYLLFSRFRAVPNAVSGFLSYDLECALLAKQHLKYPEISKRKRLQARPTHHNLLSLFTPWPWLANNTEPLKSQRRARATIQRTLQKQVLDALKQLGLQVQDKSDENRPPLWSILVQLEVKAGNWPWVLKTWRNIHAAIQRKRKRAQSQDTGLGKLLNDLEVCATSSLNYVTENEVKELAKLAFQAPGVVIGRALKRHWQDALCETGFYDTLDISWNGFRTYLDQRWFVMALGGEKNYPAAIQRAIVDGNLESVLDEHLWITSQLYSLQGNELANELRNGLRLKSSNVYLHKLGEKESRFTLRCHVALPFTKKQQQIRYISDGEEKPLRADELRRSFNTPFWPNVLATTSVGQEGLDFHVWCDTLIHWDLCRNPVDLEQREGRIQRYGGLSVRRAISGKFGNKALKDAKGGESPWEVLASLAERRLKDRSGLSPWWVCKGANINRIIFDVPLSEQDYRLTWLKKQRLLYRLVLGQPNQEDLVELISLKRDFQSKDVQTMMLNLSPYFGGL